jgi:hypothetical protein
MRKYTLILVLLLSPPAGQSSSSLGCECEFQVERKKRDRVIQFALDANSKQLQTVERETIKEENIIRKSEIRNCALTA